MNLERLHETRILVIALVLVFFGSYQLGKLAGLLPFLEPRSLLWSIVSLTFATLGFLLGIHTAWLLSKDNDRQISLLIRIFVAIGMMIFSAGLILA